VEQESTSSHLRKDVKVLFFIISLVGVFEVGMVPLKEARVRFCPGLKVVSGTAAKISGIVNDMNVLARLSDDIVNSSKKG
jgi:hypothetical protein